MRAIGRDQTTRWGVRTTGRVALVALGAVLSAAVAVPAEAATQVGFKAHSFSGFGAESSGGAITGEKPESKLWFQAGSWWASMVSPSVAGAHTIWRLVGTTWTNTGTVIDSRPASKEDILSVGSTLYVASRASGGLGGNKLRRFTFNGSSYSLDAGFPVNLPGAGEETLTIARDSTGRLWVTYESGSNVFVANSVGSDTSWSAPFVIPVTGATGISSDDISTIIAFTDSTGPAVGVMWSNQNANIDRFAVHRDSAPTNTWTVETALSGSKEADDHINLKAAEGRVYAAVKTSAAGSSKQLIRLLVRSENGAWSRYGVATVAQFNTRPITMLHIDPVQDLVYVFMTIGEGDLANGIAYKVSSTESISFGSATTFIRGPNAEKINNATSMKQNGGPASGIVVLASDGANYWWNRIGGGGPPPNTPPTADAGSATTSAGSPVGITLTATDPETCELSFSIVQQPAHGSLGALGAQACTAGSPNTDRAGVTYTPGAGFAGNDSFSFRANDGTADSAPATISVTVQGGGNTPPTAAAVSAGGTQDQPLVVGLSGTDFETCQLTFAVVSGPSNGSLSPVSDSPCSAGSPNNDSASVTYTPSPGFVGSDSFTYSVTDGDEASATAVASLTISQPSSGITFRSSSSAANAPSTSLTIPAPPGIAADDVLVAVVSARGNPNITAPAGWTPVRLDINGNAIRQGIYVRVAGASPPASYTWTLSNSQSAAGGISAYTGVETTSPVMTHSGLISPTSSSTDVVAPSVTTTSDGAMILGFFGVAANSTVAPPAGMTERFDVVSNAGTYPVISEGSDVMQTPAGATGNKTAVSGAKGWNIGQLVALRRHVP